MKQKAREKDGKEQKKDTLERHGTKISVAHVVFEAMSTMGMVTKKRNALRNDSLEQMTGVAIFVWSLWCDFDEIAKKRALATQRLKGRRESARELRRRRCSLTNTNE